MTIWKQTARFEKCPKTEPESNLKNAIKFADVFAHAVVSRILFWANVMKEQTNRQRSYLRS